jgi:small subunit ribosomal protein S27Ae
MGEERAASAKEKKIRSKEKKKRTGRKHESLEIWKYYEVKDGSLRRKKANCPRCGPGTFLSEHKDRLYCGRCGYTQFGKKEKAS